MLSADEIRDSQRAAWGRLSESWEKWDSIIMDQLGPVGTAMIERLAIAEDQEHLDIASGTGEPGLSIARLAPKGRVMLTDLSAEMLDVAARRAQAQGIANIETQVCSAATASETCSLIISQYSSGEDVTSSTSTSHSATSCSPAAVYTAVT